MDQSMMYPITVVAIDRDPMAESVLRMLFKATSIQLLDVYTSVSLALAAIEQRAPHVVLLDLELGSPNPTSSLAQILRIRRVTPTSACIVLTSSNPDAATVASCYWAGADGCFRKGFISANELISIIEDLAAKETDITQTLAVTLINASGEQSKGLAHPTRPVLRFTETELIVLRKRAIGEKVGQIAEELKVPVSVTKRIFYTIITKLHESAWSTLGNDIR